MIRPVILCGGAGTRLWPVSRQLMPKHMLSLIGDQSLLQQTAMRLTGAGFAPAIVVSAEDQSFLINRQLEEAGAPIEAILLEPTARNTSAAATLAAVWLTSSGRDELLLLMPSDHVILDREAFLEAIAAGKSHAEAGAIVTFGVPPTEASTQYGYIEAQGGPASSDGASPIARFVEKPSAEKATEYLATGRFLWNAGIFLAKASTLIAEMREFLPASSEAITSAVATATRDGVFVRPDADAFARAENISIDHGVMEKTSRGIVLPAQMGWSDVGSWDAVWKLGPQDASGNVINGEVFAIDTCNSLLRSDDGPLVAVMGLEGMAAIAVRDAVLVAPLERMSDLKTLIEGLRPEHGDLLISPHRHARSWGSSETIRQGSGFQVNHVIVDPGSMLPIQMHAGRSEHWVIVRGSAKVSVGDTMSVMRENESIYIAAGTPHRLENPGEVPLELITVQFSRP